jgi:hypothetical protein
MKYALILFVLHNGPAITKIEGYASREECRAAGVEAINEAGRVNPYMKGSFLPMCIQMPKGK